MSPETKQNTVVIAVPQHLDSPICDCGNRMYAMYRNRRECYEKIAQHSDTRLVIPEGIFHPSEGLEQIMGNARYVIVDGWTFGDSSEDRTKLGLSLYNRFLPLKIGQSLHDVIDIIRKLVHPSGKSPRSDFPEIAIPLALEELKQRSGSITPIVFYTHSDGLDIYWTQELLKIGYDWVWGGWLITKHKIPLHEGFCNIAEGLIEIKKQDREEEKQKSLSK